MRYQNLSAFQKHLSAAAPHNLCRLYLIGMADDFERTKAIDSILAHLPVPPTRFSGADCNLKDCLDAMQSGSLFGEAVVVIDEIEKFGKKEQVVLADCVKNIAGYLILGTRSKTSLVAAVDAQGVVLDLLEEKPWDKEKRLIEELCAIAKKSNKILDGDVPQLLIERLGVDSALLFSEVEKLVCYVGERLSITRQDVLQISPASRTSTLWQTAEEVIWEGKTFGAIDESAFHGLIPALRSQLHIGLTLATLIDEKCPSDQWNRYLPKLWPKMLEKRSSSAARLGAPYFRKGLTKLSEIELLSRSVSTKYRALLDLFRGYLHAR